MDVPFSSLSLEKASIMNIEKSDDMKFLEACDIAKGQASVTALAVRRAIADTAGVSPNEIFANQSFARDLVHMGGWDSLDTLDFVMTLESHLGRPIAPKVAERLPGLSDEERADVNFLVRDFVRGIVDFIGEEQGTSANGV